MPNKLNDLEADLDTIRRLGYLPPDKRGDVEAVNLMRHRRVDIMLSFREAVENRREEILRHACMHLYERYGQLHADQLIPRCPEHTCVYEPGAICRACEWGRLSVSEPEPKRG